MHSQQTPRLWLREAMSAGVVDQIQLRPPVGGSDILAASLTGRKISTWAWAGLLCLWDNVQEVRACQR